MNVICRCRICNAVSSNEIATNAGDQTRTRFTEESDGLGYLCHYCSRTIGESLAEFEEEEEEWDE